MSPLEEVPFILSWKVEGLAGGSVLEVVVGGEEVVDAIEEALVRVEYAVPVPVG